MSEEEDVSAVSNDHSLDCITIDRLLNRQDAELKALAIQSKLLLKAANKSNRAEIEARIIQMEYDLKAKHREEQDELEERSGQSIDTFTTSQSTITTTTADRSLEMSKAIESKKAKAQRKKDKKQSKESAKESQKEELRNTAGPSLREIELMNLNRQLAVEGYKVREVMADGNCLYRAIADQLLQVSGESLYDFIELRQLAAKHLREHYDDYAPFLDVSSEVDYEVYCSKVESSTLAEWGGQVEIRAISTSLQRPIIIYDAEIPKLAMGENHASIEPLRLTYHRHYYALGEHYNSVEKIRDETR